MFFKSIPLVILTFAQLVPGAVTVEVVTLAVLACVPLVGVVVPLLALARAADAVSVVAADVGAVVPPTGLVHVLRGHVVAAALALSAHASFVAPVRWRGGQTRLKTINPTTTLQT